MSLLTLISCTTAFAQSANPASTAASAPKTKVTRGKASFYGGRDGFDGKTTTDGSTFNHHEHTTAATKVIPLGSEAEVTNLKTGESTKVIITDRGPFVPVPGRKIDLSKDVAKEIGIGRKEGVAPVKIEVTKPPEDASSVER